eukprot:155687_1
MGILFGKTCCGNKNNGSDVPNVTVRCDPSSAWSTAVHEGNWNEVQSIHNDKPKSLNSRVNLDGETALHVAVKRKDMKLIEFLLSQNADVNIQSIKTGNTPLHEAASRQNIYILTMLLHYGANPRIFNSNNKIPKSLATDRQIKSMFKPQNIQRIRNQRSLRELLQTPNETKHQSSLPRQDSLEMTSSLPSGRELTIDESYIAAITECDQDIDHYNDPEPLENALDDGKVTDFGTQVGVELHEVIFFFQHLPDKAQFWNQIIGESKDKITTSKELFKLTYALIYATIKIRHNWKIKEAKETHSLEPLKKPPSDSIKELTRILKHKIKRGREQFSLSKIEYIVEFNNYLYEASLLINAVDDEDDSDLALNYE